MATVTLIVGSANITPWGQRVEGNKPFDCFDPEHLQFFNNNRRYRVGEAAKPPIRRAGQRRVVTETPAPAPPPVAAPVADPVAAPASAPDLSVLDGSIASLRKALATGDHDDHLDALESAEQAGKTRKGAVEAIQERVAKLARD